MDVGSPNWLARIAIGLVGVLGGSAARQEMIRLLVLKIPF